MRSKLLVVLAFAATLTQASFACGYTINMPPSSIDLSYDWGRPGLVRLRMATFGDKYQLKYIKLSVGSKTTRVSQKLFNDLLSVDLSTAQVGLRDDGHYVITFKARQAGTDSEQALSLISLYYSGSVDYERSIEDDYTAPQEKALPTTLEGEVASVACNIGTLQLNTGSTSAPVIRLIRFSPNTPLLRKSGGNIECSSLYPHKIAILSSATFDPNSVDPIEAAVIIAE